MSLLMKKFANDLINGDEMKISPLQLQSSTVPMMSIQLPYFSEIMLTSGDKITIKDDEILEWNGIPIKYTHSTLWPIGTVLNLERNVLDIYRIIVAGDCVKVELKLGRIEYFIISRCVTDMPPLESMYNIFADSLCICFGQPFREIKNGNGVWMHSDLGSTLCIINRIMRNPRFDIILTNRGKIKIFRDGECRICNVKFTA